MSSNNETKDVVENFASILKSSSPTKCALYSEEDQRNVKQNNISLSSIMSNINATVKTLQKADDVRIKRLYKNNLNKYKKAHFVPVPCLKYNSVIHPDPTPTKFETQCFSGSQLLTVVETAEAIFDSEDEITKEFKVPFNISTINDNVSKKGEKCYCKSNNEADNNFVKIDNNKSLEKNERTSEGNELNVTLTNIQDESGINIDEGVKSPILKLTSSFQSNKPIDEISKIMDFFNNEKKLVKSICSGINLGVGKGLESKEVIDIKPLPLLKPNCKESTNQSIDVVDVVNRICSPGLSFPNLISIDLQTFEEFESSHIQPYIENDYSQSSSSPLTQYNDSKNMTLNSKNIIGQDLNKQRESEDEDFTTDFFIQPSPVEAIQVSKYKHESVPEDFDESEKEIINKDNNTTNKKAINIILEDELLFSSDEEVERKNNKVESLQSTDSLQSPSLSNKCESLNTHIQEVHTELPTVLASDLKSIINKNFETSNQTNAESAINRNELISSPIFKSSNNIKDVINNLEVNKNRELKTISFNGNEFVNKSNNIKNDFTTSENYQSKNGDINRQFNNLASNSSLKRDFKDIDLKDIFNYSGFSTASNKRIKISELALQKTKNIFDDIGEKYTLNLINKTSLPGFKTASNKNIPISEDALQKTFTMFKDLENNNPNESFDDLDITNKTTSPLFERTPNIDSGMSFAPERSKEPFQTITTLEYDKNNISFTSGFTTASNKKIKISEEALQKTKRLFNDLNQNETDELESFLQVVETNYFTWPTENVESKKLIPETKSLYNEFIMAGNKTVNTSNEALHKTNDLFKNIDTNILNLNEKEASSTGFNKTSNKSILISKEPLEKIKHLFHDLKQDMKQEQEDTSAKIFFDDMKLTLNTLQSEETNINNEENKHENTEFITASNNKLNISEDALAKTKNIFDDVKYTQSGETIPIPKTIVVNNKQPRFGFTTASNKKVNISEDALAKTKNIFDDIKFTQSDETIPIPKTNVDNKQPRFGFTTASNKKVNISEDALAKTKNIFDDIKFTQSDEIIAISKTIVDNNKPPLFGFTTASNKKVNISEDALAKTKNIFDDIKFIQSDEIIAISKTIVDNNKPPFFGFTTASNKKVNISEDALAKTKNIFDDIKFTQSDETIPIPKTNFDNKQPRFGFTTASNKKVNISEDALAKTKNIFDDIKFTQSDEIIAISKTIVDNNKPPLFGFTTASNKKVNISEDALAKTKNIFDDIKFTQSNETIVIPKTDVDNKQPRFGFTTASNKKVIISEDALAKTKSLFNDINFTQSDAIISPETINKKDYISDDVEDLKFLSDNIILKTEQYSTNSKEVESTNEIFNVDKLLNTQVVKNFEEAMYTEDFCSNTITNTSKRSGSPILHTSLKRIKINETSSQAIPQTNNKKGIEVYEFDSNYKKIKLRVLKDIPNDYRCSNKDSFLNKYNFDDILNVEFEGSRNKITEHKIHIQELIEIFIKSVDSKIIPKGWIEIQLKLILWKLISYEQKFGEHMALICNTREVLNQLKYRYDRELNRMERPALRKIYERDDIASKSIVLCVVNIVQESNNEDKQSVTNINNAISLELTDGWYFIRTILDKFLTKMVVEGKIVIGTKLITSGAELLNCDQGIEPWEDTSNVRLKIFGNSTRRVRWHTRLGYHGDAAILTPLSTVSVEGGKVSKLRVYVTRVYPMLFIEKFEDGSTVTRSQRQEELHQIKFEQERQIELEKLMEEVQNETEDLSQDSREEIWSSGTRHKNCGTKRKSYDSGSQIAKVMKNCKDVQEFCATLTRSQLNLLTEYNNRKQEEKISKLQEKVHERIKNKQTNLSRNVIALLKVQIADFSKQNGASSAILSIWKANESFLEVIKENSWIDIFDVAPTAFRNNELHLSAGLRSIITPTKGLHKQSKMADQIDKIKRICTPIKELVKNINTKSNEIDTVGLIFLIEPSNIEFNKNTNQNFQNIYLSDENKNFVCINFWGGLKKYGFESILEEGIFIAGINLQKRLGNTRKNIPHFRVTEFSYFTKTPKFNETKILIDTLSNKLKSINIKKYCIECIELKNKFEKFNSYISPYRVIDKSEYNLSKHKNFFESPLKNNCNTNLTPNQLLKKQIIKEKMAKLEKYGEPPPLCPLNIINTSTKIFDEYKSPLLKNNVASIENIRPNSDSPNIGNKSPVLNKNVIKLNYANPVRLDFNDKNNSFDHFAEEFDCSPPLSFDSNS